MRQQIVHDLASNQAWYVVMENDPLVVPDRLLPGLNEEIGLGHAGSAKAIDQPVVEDDHRHVQLRDEEVDVVAGIADEGHPARCGADHGVVRRR